MEALAEGGEPPSLPAGPLVEEAAAVIGRRWAL
jgi:hypothetical protein